jgi:hypothetical protein
MSVVSLQVVVFAGGTNDFYVPPPTMDVWTNSYIDFIEKVGRLKFLQYVWSYILTKGCAWQQTMKKI